MTLTLPPSRTLTILTFALLTTACADPVVGGTWTQSDATTPLPDRIAEGEFLNIDATLDIDDLPATPTFTLSMDLEALGLTDRIVMNGTCTHENGQMVVDITGFEIDPASGNSAEVDEDGNQCITLVGFARTPVCFEATQTSDIELGNESFTWTLTHTIASDPGSTTFDFTRAM